nr:synaptobrevin, longin-like domain protein [Tanacetum cinerariifolium]
MAVLRYRDEHNKVGYLLKPIGSDDYHQLVDFLRASHIRYALTHNPIIFDSLVKQFWSTAMLGSPELGPLPIQATIDKTPYTITEDLVRSRLQLADDGGIDDLPIAEIYFGMDNLGYVTEGKLTFFKNKFSPQWRFLVHTILHCLSTKSGSWDQFGSLLAVTLICLSDGRRFNWSSYIFKGMVSNIGNAKKFLMYPRFLQAILGPPMLLLRAMLAHDQEGDGAGVAAQAVPQHMPAPDQPQDHLSTPPRQQTSDPHAPIFKHGQSSDPTIAADTFTNVEDEPLGGSFHMSPPSSTQAPPASQTLGGAEDPIILTVLSFVVFTLLAVTVDFNIPPGGASHIPAASISVPTAVPTGASTVPAGSPSVPADVPPSVAPADVLNKGKSLMIEEDIPVKARTFKQMQEDILGEQAAKRAQVEANASLSKILLGDDVSVDNFPVRMAALIKRRKQALAAELAKERRNRPMTQAQQRTYMRQFVKNPKFEKIQKAISNIQIQAFSRTLKRTGPVLEEPSSKRQKYTEAPILSVPEVPHSPVVSSPTSSGTRRKSLNRKLVSNKDSDDEAPLLWFTLVGWELIPTPLEDINAFYRIDRSTTHFTTLRQILHMVDRQDLVTLYGLVVKYYENHHVAGVGLILWGDLQVLFDSHEGDVSYPLSVKLMELMLKHKLEIDKDVVGNDMTTAEQLIQFIKNQLAAVQVSSA